jgi:hypothetical protein
MQLTFSCKKLDNAAGSAIPVVKKRPVANGGPDFYLKLSEANSVVFDGSKSMDTDGKINGWLWRKVEGANSVFMVDSNTVVATVYFIDSGVYQFELKVTDDDGLTSLDTVRVTVSGRLKPNSPPFANAGPDKFLRVNDLDFILDGSGSTDPDDNIIAYVWKQLKPDKQVIMAGSPTMSVTSTSMRVTGFEKGEYIFELTVTDAMAAFTKDTVTVTVDDGECGVQDSRPMIKLDLEQVGKLSIRRSSVNTTSTGDKIFFASGHELGGNLEYGSSRVDIYDVRTRTWSIGELAKRRSDVAAVSLGDKVFFAGGRLGDGAFDELFSEVDIYDVSSNSWTTAHLSERRAFIGAASAGTKVFFAGGEKDASYNTSSVVDIFDVTSGSWSRSSLSEARSGVAVLAVEDKVYFAGGHREDRWYQSPSDRIDLYDIRSGTWSMSSLVRPSGEISGLFTGDFIYWLSQCHVDIMNLKSGQFKMETVSQAITYSSYPFGEVAFSLNGRVLVTNNDIMGNLKFDIYEPLTGKWSIGLLPKEIKGASIVRNRNEIYITGLTKEDGDSSPVWKLTF